MRNFIKLTNRDGDEVMVNSSYILYIEKVEDGSYVKVSFSDHSAIRVTETPEEIIKKIDKSEYVTIKTY